ncbi:hypothetical protein [Gordonia sp. NPDC003429]
MTEAAATDADLEPSAALRVSRLEPLVAGGSGLLSLLTLLDMPPLLRLLLLLPLILVGFGAAVSWRVRMPGHLRLALYPSLGLAAPIGLGTTLIWVGLYSPDLVTCALSMVCLISSFLALRTPVARMDAWADLKRMWGRVKTDARDVRSKRMGALAAVAVLWVGALWLMSRESVGLFGLMFTWVGLALAVCLVAIVGIFFTCLYVGDTVGAAVTILATIGAIRLPATLLTDVPIYSWTYKHIGLVEYVAQNSSLPPSFIDIYSSWPGFFVGGAWFSSATGIAATDVAHWFAPVTHLLLAVSIWALARAFSLSRSAGLISVMFAELVNWVGQDYYSPQAVALIIGVAILALLVSSRTYTGAAYFVLPLFAVITATHQLTPVWILAVAVMFTLLNRVRPIWLAAACLGIWVAFVIPRATWISRYGGFTGVNPFKNSKTNLPNLPGDSLARTLLQDVDRGVFITVWAAAFVSFIYLWRCGRGNFALPVLAFSSGLLLGGQSYGGEAIFRVLLYSLVGCSILVGAALSEFLRLDGGVGQRIDDLRTRIRTFTVALVVALLGVTALHSYYGGWAYIQLTKGQVEMSRQMLSNAKPSTVIVQIGPSGWPPRATADYVRLAEVNPGFDKALIFLKESMSRGFPTREDIRFLDRLGRGTDGSFYIVLPRQMSAYSDYFGYFRKGAIESLVTLLDEDPNFYRAHSDSDTIVFGYRHIPTEREPW